MDVLTFTSSSTVRNFVEQVGQSTAQALATQARVVTIGPITAATAREFGLRVDVVATEHTIAGLVDAMTTDPLLTRQLTAALQRKETMARFDDYAEAYQTIRMERRQGILQMTFHTNGGPLQWGELPHREFATGLSRYWQRPGQ